MRRTIIVILSATLNAGCAFVSVESNASRFISNPTLTAERAKLDCDGSKNATTSAEKTNKVTKLELKNAWGEPDDIVISNNIEQWTYKTNLRWNGIWGALIVIPVPLVIPTGHERMVVDIYDGMVQSVEVHYQVGSEHRCGFVFIHGGGWYCANGEPNYYYGFHSSFCGYGNDLLSDK